MRKLRNLFFLLMRYSGMPFLIRELFQRRRVTIVMLHDPAPDVAEKTFAYLASRYHIIDLNTFLEARRRGDSRALPPKAMIITMDDGHIRNYQLLPIIKKLNIPITIFLCAGIINTNRHYWFKFKHPDLFKPALKQMPTREKLEWLAEAGFWPEKEFPNPLALTKDQIREMKPHVNFQGHTSFHPCLPRCTRQAAWEEIAGSKQILEQDFGLPVNAIAFPNGDYSERDIELVKAAGYSCAITVDFGFNTIHTDPFRLKRLSIDDADNVDTVCVKASGIWTLLLHWLGKRRFSGKMAPLPQKAVAGAKALKQTVPVIALSFLSKADLITEAICSTLN